ALTPLDLTPGAKRVRRANGTDRKVHFEIAAVVVHESHNIGDGPSTVIGEGAAVRCSRETAALTPPLMGNPEDSALQSQSIFGWCPAIVARLPFPWESQRHTCPVPWGTRRGGAGIPQASILPLVR